MSGLLLNTIAFKRFGQATPEPRRTDEASHFAVTFANDLAPLFGAPHCKHWGGTSDEDASEPWRSRLTRTAADHYRGAGRSLSSTGDIREDG